MKWTRHYDGWVSSNVGVFPYFVSGWEIWVRYSDGEWAPMQRQRIEVYNSLVEAKLAAEMII